MKFKHRKKQEKKHRSGEIPTGSFSDIAFLLIIYFILATTLIKVKAITADLPSGEKGSQTQSEKTTIINLRGTEIRLNDKKVTVEELDDELAGMYLSERPPEKRVIMLETRDDTPYEIYFQTWAAISANDGVVAIVEPK